MKKTLKITGIALLLLLAFAFAAPFLFKDKITALIKEQVNKHLTARVDFASVDLSLFRHFPRLSVALDSLRITGTGEFAEDTLVSASRIDVALNLLSVIKGEQMVIHSITFDQPRIHAIVHKNGHANWAITLPDTAASASPSTPAASKPFKMALQKYAIHDAVIDYQDQAAGMSCLINGLDHSGKGDFTSDLFTLSTSTKAGAVSFNYGGIPYLAQTSTGLNADFQVDNKTSKYSFKVDQLNLNDLTLHTAGFFQLVNDSTYAMDISFSGPSLDFKHLLSLVPAIYKKDFASIRASGQASLDGFVKGTYDSRHIPAYHVGLEVKDGNFQYPDLPKPVKNINLSLKADNPDGVSDHTVLDISHGHLEMAEMPFDFRLLVKTPVSDPYIDAAAKGKLDLGKITQFVKLDAGTKLSGILDADMNARGNMSAVNKMQKATATQTETTAHTRTAAQKAVQPGQSAQKPGAHPQPSKGSTPPGAAPATVPAVNPPAPQFPGQFFAGGTIGLSDFFYSSAAAPTGVSLEKLLLTFNPKNVNLSECKGAYGKTSFSATGTLNNLLAYALQHQTLDGSLTAKADRINLNDWMGSAGTNPATGTGASTTAGNQTGKDNAGSSGQPSTLPSTQSTTPATAQTPASPPFVVPAGISFVINATIDQLHYNTVDMQGVNGKIIVADETVKLENLQASALGGTFTIDGAYSTKVSKQHPAIAFRYNVRGLDIQKAFYAFNTVQKLMPAGKFITGKFNSQLAMNGLMGDGNTPDFTSLTGDGNLLVTEGALKNFAPTDQLAQSLHLDQFRDIAMKDLQTAFSFKNGKVIVNPFHIKMKDIDMEVGGSHGLDQSLDYIANLTLPRSLLGGQANSAINNALAQANAKGLALKTDDQVILPVKIGGTLTNPVLKMDVAGALKSSLADARHQAADLVKARVDSARQQLKDTAKALGNQALKDAGKQLAGQLFGNKDTTASQGSGLENTKKKAEETGKNLLNGLLNRKKDNR